jgi:hypothetical protein
MFEVLDQLGRSRASACDRGEADIRGDGVQPGGELRTRLVAVGAFPRAQFRPMRPGSIGVTRRCRCSAPTSAAAAMIWPRPRSRRVAASRRWSKRPACRRATTCCAWSSRRSWCAPSPTTRPPARPPLPIARGCGGSSPTPSLCSGAPPASHSGGSRATTASRTRRSRAGSRGPRSLASCACCVAAPLIGSRAEHGAADPFCGPDKQDNAKGASGSKSPSRTDSGTSTQNVCACRELRELRNPLAGVTLDAA